MFDLDTLFEAPRERPSGIARIAVLVCLQGIFRLLAALFFVVGTILGSHQLSAASILVGVIFGVFFAAVGLVTIFLSWGLWTLKHWAFLWTVVLMIVNLVMSFLTFELPTPVFWTILSMIIPAVVLIYFLAAPRARRAFQP